MFGPSTAQDQGTGTMTTNAAGEGGTCSAVVDICECRSQYVVFCVNISRSTGYRS